MVAAVIAASLLASAIVAQLAGLSDSARGMLHELSERAKTSIMLIYCAYLRNSSRFVVYAMNTGKTSIVISKLGVYFGNATKLDPYFIDTDGSITPGEWIYEEIYGVDDGIWNPGEVIAIYIYNTTAITPPYKVKIVTPNGVVAEELFTDLP